MGLSLGMYYTVTYFGRQLVPLPGFVAFGAPLQYYLVVGPVQDTTAQAWLWMLCFPAVGALWRACLLGATRLAGLRMTYTLVVRATTAAPLPLLAPAPILALVLMTGEGALSWRALVDACLRRSFEASPAWLVPVYAVVAAIALMLECRAAVHLAGARRGRVWIVAGAALATLVAVVVVGFAADAFWSFW